MMETLNPSLSIPSVCRIPGRGTAFLVGTGVLMTTTMVVPSAKDASRMTAVFFEGTKKPTVEVKLLPEQLYFASLFPEHVNYCIVACETKGIFNVVPINVPLVKKEWPSVNEGDTLLLMQHLDNEGPSAQSGATARFDEVLRKREDLYFLKANNSLTFSGCPAFDINSQLVGIQSQFRSDGDGFVSRILSISTVVKHLFANAMCGRLGTCPTISDIWDTWYVTNDTTRIISIMANFKSREVLSVAVQKLCEHTSRSDLLEGVVSCGGTRVIVGCIHQFKDDEALVRLALKSLWNISFGEVNNRSEIVEVGGIETVLEMMEMYSKNQDICEFGAVLLFNLTLESATIAASWASRCVAVVTSSMLTFYGADVLQKFSTGLLSNIVNVIPSISKHIVDAQGLISHIGNLMQTKSNNILLMEAIMPLLSSLSRAEWANPLMRPLISRIITLMVEHSTNTTILRCGNQALWSLGCDVENRIEILQNPFGTKVLGGSVHTLLGFNSGRA